MSLFAEQNGLQYAVPGGLIGRKQNGIVDSFIVCYVLLDIEK